ncbi:MAG: hypothetical protein JXM70_02395 [Pirellulales bacterium]|nr:hypothetical protein [Pirellulales bacterium]
MENTKNDLKKAVVGLLEKYAVEVQQQWDLAEEMPCEDSEGCAFVLVPAWRVRDICPNSTKVVPLFAWRKQRRFVELKKIVENRTITPVLMARFACLAAGDSLSLSNILYREFDLLEWITGQSISRMYATSAPRAMNAVVRLDDGSIASIEVATTLPSGTPIEDRHELIARRGMASDRVVDTQCRQESIYVWLKDRRASFTDVDNELYGLDEEQVALVRSAYDALSDTESHQQLRRRHEYLTSLVDAAMQSDRDRRRVVMKGASVA